MVCCNPLAHQLPQRRDHLIGRAHAHQQWQDVLDGHLVHVEFASRAAVAHDDALHVTVFGISRCALDTALRGDASYQDGLGPQGSQNGVEIVAVEGAEARLHDDPIVGLGT